VLNLPEIGEKLRILSRCFVVLIGTVTGTAVAITLPHESFSLRWVQNPLFKCTPTLKHVPCHPFAEREKLEQR